MVCHSAALKRYKKTIRGRKIHVRYLLYRFAPTADVQIKSVDANPFLFTREFKHETIEAQLLQLLIFDALIYPDECFLFIGSPLSKMIQAWFTEYTVTKSMHIYVYNTSRSSFWYFLGYSSFQKRTLIAPKSLKKCSRIPLLRHIYTRTYMKPA